MNSTAPLGLALVRPTEILGAEPYFHDLIAGIEDVTLAHGYPVLLRVLASRDEESALYRQWSRDGLVSGVFLVDLAEADARPELTKQLGLPTVVVGPPETLHHMTVWTDDDAAMVLAVDFLAGLGHRNILHVGGPGTMRHSAARRAAFEQACAERELDAITAEGDYSRASGAGSTLAAFHAHPQITAAIYDSDLMALGGLDAAREVGKAVPGSFALLAWDDSAQAQLSRPSLSAVARDTRAVGRQIGQAMLDVLTEGTTELRHATSATIIARESTAS